MGRSEHAAGPAPTHRSRRERADGQSELSVSIVRTPNRPVTCTLWALEGAPGRWRPRRDDDRHAGGSAPMCTTQNDLLPCPPAQSQCTASAHGPVLRQGAGATGSSELAAEWLLICMRSTCASSGRRCETRQGHVVANTVCKDAAGAALSALPTQRWMRGGVHWAPSAAHLAGVASVAWATASR